MIKESGFDMGNSIEERIKEFEESFKKIVEERQQAVEESVAVFKTLYEGVLPIIKVIKRNKIIFMHPDIKDVTVHGPIIAKEQNYPSNIYIYDGNFAVRVNPAKDEIETDSKIFIEKIAHNLDWDFAFKGLYTLNSYLDNVIDYERDTIDKINDITLGVKLSMERNL